MFREVMYLLMNYFFFYYVMTVFIPKNVFTENVELDINLVALSFLLFHENILSHVLAVILSAVCYSSLQFTLVLDQNMIDFCLFDHLYA